MDTNNIKLQFDTICASKNIISHIDTDGCDEEFVKATATIVKDFTKKLQELANLNKEEQEKKEIKKRWRPNLGEIYFRINWDDIVSLTWENDTYDNKYYNVRDIKCVNMTSQKVNFQSVLYVQLHGKVQSKKCFGSSRKSQMTSSF